MNSCSSLPDDIVEHIQSFMNFKEAARSACLSSRLYASWYKSPRLILVEGDFVNPNAFWFAAKKTIRRYTNARLQLQKLILRLGCGYERYYDCKKLLEDASNLCLNEISIHLSNDNFNFFIPSTVLASDHLRSFTLMGGALHVGHELPFLCRSLHTLSLLPNRSIGYRGDFVHNFILRCPALKHLTCTGFLLWFQYGSLSNVSHMLESLTVHNLDYADNVYFNEIVRFFKDLKALFLIQVLDSDRLHICSTSIQHISIEDRYRAVTAVFRVPNLLHFRFVGVTWSSLTFESPYRGWSSHIHVICYRSTGHWFTSLHRLLQRLSSSQIHLNVRIVYCNTKFICDYEGEAEPVAIETLGVGTTEPNPDLIDGLFCVCLPKFFMYNHQL